MENKEKVTDIKEVKEEYKEIEVEGKKYKIGFPTRKSAKIAEKKGLNITDETKVLTLADKLFYTGLYSYQEWITEDEAERIEEKFMEKGGKLTEITSFLSKQFMGFINPDLIQETTEVK